MIVVSSMLPLGTLGAAIDAVLEERPVNPNQKPSIGCSIKWKEL